MDNIAHRNISVYFRGYVSGDDHRQLIIGASINGKSDKLGRRIMRLGCSIGGESVVDYEAKCDNHPATQINKLYRSLFTGTYAF